MLALEIPYEQFQLDNGLVVILHEDHSLPQVVVNLWYGVGSKDEEHGRTGFAHLFEHLMFMGTVRLPGSGFDDKMEAQGGMNNAWTSEDATDYYDLGPSHLAETLLWMEADRMDGLANAMTQEKLDLQRDVVRNERRQSLEDAPYGVVWLEYPRVMWPESHPYAHTVIGSHEDLVAATVGDVTGFFGRWYVPNNASLVVAGDFDKATVKAAVERMFGHLPRVPLGERSRAPSPDRPQVPLLELTDQVQIPMSVMLWHTPAVLEPGDAELDLLAAVLADGRSSRLYKRLVHEEGRALEVDAGQYSQALGSLYMITVKPTDEHTIEELEAAVAEEIAKIATDGPTPAEMERVQNNNEMHFIQELESLRGRAESLNRYRYVAGDPGWFTKDLDRYRAVTAEGIRQAAERLTIERRAVIRVRPEAAPAEGEAPGEGGK